MAELIPIVSIQGTCVAPISNVFVVPCSEALVHKARMGISIFLEEVIESSIIFLVLLSIITILKQFHLFFDAVCEVVLTGTRYLMQNVYKNFSEAVRKLGDFGSY